MNIASTPNEDYLNKIELRLEINKMFASNFSVEKIEKKIPKEYWEDKKFCFDMLDVDSSFVQFFDKKVFYNLTDNEKILLFQLLTKEDVDTFISKDIVQEMLSNPQTQIELLINSPMLLKYADNELKSNEILVINFVKEMKRIREQSLKRYMAFNVMDFISKDILKDFEFVLKLIDIDFGLVNQKSFLENIVVDVEVIKKNYFLADKAQTFLFFALLPEKDITKEMYIKYIEKNKNIDFHEEKPMFSDDLDVIKALVKKEPNFYNTLSIDVKNNQELVEYLLMRKVNIVKDMPKELFKNRNISNAICMLKKEDVWQYIPKEVKKDLDFVTNFLLLNTFKKEMKMEMGEKNFNQEIIAKILMEQGVVNYSFLSESMREKEEFICMMLEQGIGMEYGIIPLSCQKDATLSLKLVSNPKYKVTLAHLLKEVSFNRDFIINVLNVRPALADFYLKKEMTKKGEWDIKTDIDLMMKIKDSLGSVLGTYKSSISRQVFDEIYSEIDSVLLRGKLDQIKPLSGEKSKKKL